MSPGAAAAEVAGNNGDASTGDDGDRENAPLPGEEMALREVNCAAVDDDSEAWT